MLLFVWYFLCLVLMLLLYASLLLSSQLHLKLLTAIFKYLHGPLAPRQLLFLLDMLLLTAFVVQEELSKLNIRLLSFSLHLHLFFPTGYQ